MCHHGPCHTSGEPIASSAATRNMQPGMWWTFSTGCALQLCTKWYCPPIYHQYLAKISFEIEQGTFDGAWAPLCIILG